MLGAQNIVTSSYPADIDIGGDARDLRPYDGEDAEDHYGDALDQNQDP